MRIILILFLFLFLSSCDTNKESQDRINELEQKIGHIEESVSKIEKQLAINSELQYAKVIAEKINIRSSQSTSVDNIIAIASSGSYLRKIEYLGKNKNWIHVEFYIGEYPFQALIVNDKDLISIEKISLDMEQNIQKISNIKFLWQNEVLRELGKMDIRNVAIYYDNMSVNGRDIYTYNLSKYFKKKNIYLKEIFHFEKENIIQICDNNSVTAILHLSTIEENGNRLLRITLYDFNGFIRFKAILPEISLNYITQ